MEKYSEDKHLFKRGRNNGKAEGIGFAVFPILLGAVFLLLNTGVIPKMYKPLLISWQMLLIVFGVWALIKRQFTWGMVLIIIGGFFIYPVLSRVFPESFASINIDFKTYWPVLLIVVGLFLVIGKANLFGSKRSRRNEWQSVSDGNNEYRQGTDDAQQSSTDFIEKSIMFGSSEQIVLSSNFMGGEGNVMFGELIVDLRRAQLAEGIYKLELNVMFGSIVLYVPPGWHVELQASSILGSFDDKRYRHEVVANSPSKLIVKGSAMFGGGEIRS